MNEHANWLSLSDYALHAAVCAVVAGAWVAFEVVLFLFLRRRPVREEGAEQRRDARSRVGFALQGLSYVVVLAFMRERFTHIASLGRVLDIAVALLTAALAVASVWLIRSAFSTLGAQWSLTARVLADHKLITAGVYGYVRHPIYTGMLGLLLATGLAASRPVGLLAGLIVFWAGTLVRVRSEERLLRAAFGADYDDYARRVPAVLPGIY
ncbi:MAG TPA: isoprenylcysteine carboxylmethyltransferase family protein [Pyrinomonadaceae bacterium]|nr:isoprenylcysteine carboxylmethyltransferase family protein [Pyrinomonadaceae bacterium]